MTRVLPLIWIAMAAAALSCSSEWCEDDCALKMVFTVVNEDPVARVIAFKTSVPDSTTLSNREVIFHPDTNVQHTLAPGAMYTDSLCCRTTLHAQCGCYLDQVARGFVVMRVRDDGGSLIGNLFSSVRPVCVGCAPPAVVRN